jgi:flagellum-specific peptidoglycan hydrolase FlgJ
MAMAVVGLVLTLAGPWPQGSIERMTRGALDDLGSQDVAVQQIDLTDGPAMDPGLAWILKPRTTYEAGIGRARRGPVQTLRYEVRNSQPLHDIAAPPTAQTDTRDTDLLAPPDALAWQADVILSLAPGAQKSQQKSGVPASVTIAQAILESDWGRSRLATEAKNLFGIKAFGRPGTAGIYTAPTWEVSGGQNVTVAAAFRAYNTLEDSIEDHGNWFHDNARYWPALAVKDDARAFARAIHAAGYATDPAYAPKLIALMDRFNLYQYDIQPLG